MAKNTTIPEENRSSQFMPKIDRALDCVPEQKDSAPPFRGAAALTVAILISISALFVLVTLPTNTVAESHDPIYINGDLDFEDGMSTSGVRSGTGVEGDPYIISDWEIVITVDHGIWIRDTDAYFVIRNVSVSQASYSPTLNFNGIHLTNANNGIVENCTFTGWLKKGVYTMGSTNLLITNNSVAIEPGPSGDRYGIEVYSTPLSDVTVDGNTVTNGNYGIMISYTDDITVKNNQVSSVTDGGLLLMYSEGDTVWNNTMADCGVNLWIGTLAESNTHVISENNTVNGNPVYYEKDETGILYDGISAGQLIFANCQDITVEDMSFADCDVGVQLCYCTDVSLTRITIADTLYNGMTVWNVDDFEMTESTISGCGRVGLEIWDGSDFTVAGCDIVSNEGTAVLIQYGLQLNLTGCNLSYNSNIGSCGVDYRMPNNITDLQSKITYNVFRDNYYGVSLSKCRGVMVHHNNFIDNTFQAKDNEIDINQWDDGEEGNYWSDYSGADDELPYGIGDTPYDIDGNTFDNYPLMEVHVIPEFGHVVIPVIIILVMFGILLRKRNE